MPNIELVNPEDNSCPYSWGDYLGKETCPCHKGQDKYQHECSKNKGHRGKHACGHCGEVVKK